MNRLDRDFTATGMDRKWAADITCIHTDEGFLYLAGIVDLFSRRIVGWAMKDTLHADLCVEALEMALVNRRPKHPVLHHSDRGCQYAGKQYQDKLIEFSLECSMGGAPGDPFPDQPIVHITAFGGSMPSQRKLSPVNFNERITSGFVQAVRGFGRFWTGHLRPPMRGYGGLTPKLLHFGPHHPSGMGR